jgi:2-methylcitrate dehydratase PrpD
VSVTEELATFVADLSYEEIPDDARRLAERCFVDTAGVTYAGMERGAGATARRALGAVAGDGPVSILGADEQCSLLEGTFINGTASHGLDFDDVSDGVNGHPSVGLVPPLLAVGEATEASGKDLITGFVAGFEVACYIAQAIRPGHYEAGWHPTSAVGTFTATAAAASVLELDTDAVTNAFNSAASMAAGLKRNFGSMTKPMHVGHATRAGVTAALLADEGFTAGEDVVAGDQGFWELYGGPEPPHSSDTHELGRTWAATEFGVGVKKYPCCYFTHASIEAASRLVDEHNIDPEAVESVHVVASRGAGDALQHPDPDGGLEGKFSMHYAIASAIARDDVGPSAFEDENIDEPSVQRVRERVNFDVDPDLTYGSYRTQVTIETAEQSVSMTLDDPPGTHDDPLSEAELRGKFEMCVSRAVSSNRVDDLYETFNSLRTVDDISAVDL